MSAFALIRKERRLRRLSKDEQRIVASWFEAAQGRLLTIRGQAAPSGLPIDALDPCDHGFSAQLGDNSAEMLQVIDLKIDG
jgi:hypothetical protein